jgi:hypothetical protein
VKKPIFILLLACVFLYSASLSLALEPQEKEAEKAEPKQEKTEEKTPQKPAAPPEKKFDEVIKDAEKMEGLFNLYAKDDKLYLEIRPDQFGRLYLYIPTLWTSVGYGGTGSYFPSHVFLWEKLDKKVLLTWKNTRYTVEKSPEYKRNLENVVPQSIAHAFKIESEPHPETKSVLIDADSFFLSDCLGLAQVYSRPQNPYSMDKSRTVWGKVKAFPQNIELEVRYTLSSTKPVDEPSVPDPGAFTVHARFSISELPVDNGFVPRLADDRVGYFMQEVFDYDRNELDGTVVRYINRRHLVKKNPKAAVSEPVEPIVFWLENTIPPEYRPPIRDGLLEWNKAFEKAGFKNAVVVKEMPDDAEWDPADVRYSTIRWAASLAGVGGGAFGPSRVNPMTGQILDADVVMFAPINYIFSYNVFDSPLNARFTGEWGHSIAGEISPWGLDNLMLGFERDYAVFEMLANGEIRDVKDVPKQFMYDFYKFLGCHEVGHTLGLRHNFKGSIAIKLKDLQNQELTRRESIGNSIMEYLPRNTAPKGVKQGEYFQSTIGAWDYWAIEYGYKPLGEKGPDAEVPALQKMASRSNEPELIYGTDEDAYDFGPYSVSVDPECITWDLSDDPLSWSIQQVERTKDLWKQLEERALFEGRSYVYLRNGFAASLGQYFGSMSRVVKWIGGLYHKRTHVGDQGGVLPFEVVEYEKQRRAFDIIRDNLLRPDAFSFDPELLKKLQASRFLDFSAVYKASATGAFRLDFALSDYLKRYYKSMLGMLYDPLRLSRIQENEARTQGKKLTLSDYLGELHASIWEEIGKGAAISPYRRILQREYLGKVTEFILKPPAPTPDDVISIARYQLKKLDTEITDYLTKNLDADLATRAHLEGCSDSIHEALQAVFVKDAK